MPAVSPTDCSAASFFTQLSQDLRQLKSDAAGHPLPGAELSWREWVRRSFPSVCSRPFGARHVRLWEWFEALTPGERPRPRVDVWPRGGAKSSTGELGCCRVGVKLSRRFVLYVSETQEQADKHVQAIATLFERIGAERMVGTYGHSKGWRRDQLRTANGFNVAAYGLDTAARGVKLDEFRPDLLVFDDIDHQDDSEKTVRKKIAAITTSILPTGSPDCASLFLQNLIHEEGIVAQLVDGRADFLRDRETACVEPAVHGLETELRELPDGRKRYFITGGTPTWAGQDLATCEAQINEWGLSAFRREAQHEVKNAGGFFFDVDRLWYIDAREVPPWVRRARAWDLAATEGGGDHTAGLRMAMRGTYPDVDVYIEDVCCGQWGSHNVRRKIRECAETDGAAVDVVLPQDPGQAGKSQAEQFRAEYERYIPRIASITGDKATRARGWAEAVNLGRCYVVRAPWNFYLKEQLRKFREDEKDQDDDAIDAGADAFNHLVRLPDLAPVERARDPEDQSWLPHALRSEPRSLGTPDGLDDLGAWDGGGTEGDGF